MLVFIFMLSITSCISFNPILTVDELEKTKDGTFLAINLRHHYKNCWLQLDSLDTPQTYNIDLFKEENLYILEILPGSYELNLKCYNHRNYRQINPFSFLIAKDKINYLGTIGFHFNHVFRDETEYSIYFVHSQKILDFVENRFGSSDKTRVTRIATSTGGLSQEEILNVIRENLNNIRTCYEGSLKDDPKLKGKIYIRFIVDKSGKVKTAGVINATITVGKMQSCIIDEIETWVFPKPRGGSDVTVNYPFSFDPQ